VNASGFLMADDAVWDEHAASGYVFTDEETVSAPGCGSIAFAQRATGPASQ
jgi:hypothetical protein